MKIKLIKKLPLIIYPLISVPVLVATSCNGSSKQSDKKITIKPTTKNKI
ncbi:hypothetical protein KQ878_03490 [Mycoplasma zalophidermidis]|uniref:Variable surface lipoprotein n=1 Tax=Mycoplasma zalophidermidis TaxID=398174 RepID=A0ABS6DSY9_9MOLU|nr:hypothetical protein [Mycoplasma zalophidermidis]MBU4690046.1 hypothetical protein [Mycoplasma zalophidermidis]MBU4693931.1 hypothetical protein [Mycoplasma zalophidermidis]